MLLPLVETRVRVGDPARYLPDPARTLRRTCPTLPEPYSPHQVLVRYLAGLEQDPIRYPVRILPGTLSGSCPGICSGLKQVQRTLLDPVRYLPGPCQGTCQVPEQVSGCNPRARR